MQCSFSQYFLIRFYLSILVLILIQIHSVVCSTVHSISVFRFKTLNVKICGVFHNCNSIIILINY